MSEQEGNRAGEDSLPPLAFTSPNEVPFETGDNSDPLIWFNVKSQGRKEGGSDARSHES